MIPLVFPDTPEGRAATKLRDRKIAMIGAGDRESGGVRIQGRDWLQSALIGTDLSSANLYACAEVIGTGYTMYLIEEGVLPAGFVDSPEFPGFCEAIASLWMDGAATGALARDEVAPG